MQKRNLLLFFLLLVFGLTESWSQTIISMDTLMPTREWYYREGKASYYSNSFHGRKTANGERYNKNKLTAAHLTLPFGTRVKVTNKKTGKWVIVIINDRGPYNHKYLIDLSYRAAKHLGMTNGKGWAKVVIEELPPKDKPWPQKHVPDLPGQGLKKVEE